MFTSTVGLEGKSFPTFEEAFRDFYARVKEMLSGGASYQVLETACWIEFHDEERNLRTPALIYDVTDIGYKVGLLAGKGELQTLTKPLPIDVLRREFALVKLGQSASLLSEMTDNLMDAARALEEEHHPFPEGGVS